MGRGEYTDIIGRDSERGERWERGERGERWERGERGERWERGERGWRRHRYGGWPWWSGWSGLGWPYYGYPSYYSVPSVPYYSPAYYALPFYQPAAVVAVPHWRSRSLRRLGRRRIYHMLGADY